MAWSKYQGVLAYNCMRLWPHTHQPIQQYGNLQNTNLAWSPGMWEVLDVWYLQSGDWGDVLLYFWMNEENRVSLKHIWHFIKTLCFPCNMQSSSRHSRLKTKKKRVNSLNNKVLPCHNNSKTDKSEYISWC